MNRFGMQDYLENNFDRILEGYFEWLEEIICEDVYDLKSFSNYVDDVAFYKDWSKGAKYEVSIYLREIEDCEDEEVGEEISD